MQLTVLQFVARLMPCGRLATQGAFPQALAFAEKAKVIGSANSTEGPLDHSPICESGLHMFIWFICIHIIFPYIPIVFERFCIHV